MWPYLLGGVAVVVVLMLAVLITSERTRGEVWIDHPSRRGEKER